MTNNPIPLPTISSIARTTQPNENTATIDIYLSTGAHIVYKDNGNVITQTTHKRDNPHTVHKKRIIRPSTSTNIEDIETLEEVARNFTQYFDDPKTTIGDIDEHYPTDVINTLTSDYQNPDDNIYKVNRDLDKELRNKQPGRRRMNVLLDENKNIKPKYRFPVGTRLYNNNPEGTIIEITGYNHSDNNDVVENYIMEPVNDDESIFMTHLGAKKMHRGFLRENTRLIRYGRDE